MAEARPRQRADYRRLPELGNLELLHATYTSQRFAPHFHEGHVIGVIEQGQLGFDYRGEKMVASQGQINVADPGEVHNGFAVSETGWQYRMFYLSSGQLAQVLSEVNDSPLTGVPHFEAGVIQDRELAREICSLHRDFDDPCVSFLEKETRFYALLYRLVRRHSPEKPPDIRSGREQAAVRKIRDYMDAAFGEGITLDDLSRIAGMSKFYLVRVFSTHTGMTPHAYLSQVRASKARQMMDMGRRLADVAAEAGFFDQSHLTRIFKKIYGITPGQYASVRA